MGSSGKRVGRSGIVGMIVINGSANWSEAGLRKNFENFYQFTNIENVKSFHENFTMLWDLAKPKPFRGCDLSEASCREKFCLVQAGPATVYGFSKRNR